MGGAPCKRRRIEPPSLLEPADIGSRCPPDPPSSFKAATCSRSSSLTHLPNSLWDDLCIHCCKVSSLQLRATCCQIKQSLEAEGHKYRTIRCWWDFSFVHGLLPQDYVAELLKIPDTPRADVVSKRRELRLSTQRQMAYPVHFSNVFRERLREGWRFSLERDQAAEDEADQQLDAITELRAHLIASRGSERRKIGSITGQHIDKNHGELWRDDMDAHSQELMEVMEATHDENPDMADMYFLRENLAGELSWNNQGMTGLVYISDVQVEEEWRGGGLGLFAIQELLAPIHAAEPCQQVALLHVGEDLPKLAQHFCRLGFETARGCPEGLSGYMLLDLELLRPKLRDLLPGVPLDETDPDEACSMSGEDEEGESEGWSESDGH